jgi:hypothetical protein
MSLANLFDGNKDDPIVLNFAQTQEYTDNFLVGRLLPEEEPGEKNPDTVEANGTVRKVVEWEAIDAVTRKQNDRVQRTSVLSSHLIPIGQGTVSPRKVYLLMPDRITEIPDDFTSPTNDIDPEVMEALGLVLGQLYKEIRHEKILKIVAESEPEMYSKIEELVKNSSLDDEVRKQYIRELEQLSDVGSTSGGSDSDN